MSFQRIQLAKAKELFEAGNVNVADVRDALSFQAGHIKNAKHIDNSSIGEYLTTTNKEQPLIVCCYHGNASQNVAKFFVSEGYQEVYSLDGGYEMWKLAFPELCATPRT